jgi:hypothetical protein
VPTHGAFSTASLCLPCNQQVSVVELVVNERTGTNIGITIREAVRTGPTS